MATNSDINTGKPIEVPNGGIGVASLTAYAPVCGGVNSTAALQSASTGLSTAGYVLTSNGASALPSFQPNSATAGGLILLSSQDGTGLSSVQFTSVMTTAYANYVLIISNYLPVNDSTDLLVQLSENNGGSYFGASDYTSGSIGVPYNSATWANYQLSGSGSTGFPIIPQVHNSGVPASGFCSLYTITKGTNAQPNYVCSSQSNNAVVGYGFQYSAGYSPLVQPIYSMNAIQVLPTSGNIAQGIFTLYALAE